MTRELNARQKQQIADLPKDVRERVESMINAGIFDWMTIEGIASSAFLMLAYEHEKRTKAILAATAERRKKENENANRQPTDQD